MSDRAIVNSYIWAHTTTENDVDEMLNDGMNIDDVISIAKNDRDILTVMRDRIVNAISNTNDSIGYAYSVRNHGTRGKTSRKK